MKFLCATGLYGSYYYFDLSCYASLYYKLNDKRIPVCYCINRKERRDTSSGKKRQIIMKNSIMTKEMNMAVMCVRRFDVPEVPCRFMPKNTLRSGGGL